jgi:hypothetical protein
MTKPRSMSQKKTKKTTPSQPNLSQMKAPAADEDEMGFLDRLVDVAGMPNEVIALIAERKQKLLDAPKGYPPQPLPEDIPITNEPGGA